MMFVMLPISLLWLVVSHGVSGGVSFTLGLISGLLILVLGIATVMVFYRPFSPQTHHARQVLMVAIYSRSMCPRQANHRFSRVSS